MPLLCPPSTALSVSFSSGLLPVANLLFGIVRICGWKAEAVHGVASDRTRTRAELGLELFSVKGANAVG
jgi:hypothetical protein